MPILLIQCHFYSGSKKDFYNLTNFQNKLEGKIAKSFQYFEKQKQIHPVVMCITTYLNILKINSNFKNCIST